MCTQFTSCHRRFMLLIVTAAVISWPQLVGAQSRSAAGADNDPARGAAPPENEYVLRTYGISDLIVNIHDYPYSQSLEGNPTLPSRGGFGGGGFGGGGGGFGFFDIPEGAGVSRVGRQIYRPVTRLAAASDAAIRFELCQFGGGGGRTGADSSPSTASITVDDLIRVLTNTVAQDSWEVHGGDGQVEPLGTALVVWQTRAIHAQIEELLSQIRLGSADRRTVTIDARWLLLNSDELDSLLVPNPEGVPQVDRRRLAEFTRRPDSIRGMTSCFSSQLVYLVSGTRRNVVSSFIPVVGSVESPVRGQQFAHRRDESVFRFASDTPTVGRGREPGVGYQPIIEKPNLGALLEIRPTLVHSNGPAVVDLKSTITVLGEQPPKLGANTQSDSIAPEIDRIAIEVQEFATTLRIPLGKPVLVGGLTYVPASIEVNQNRGQRQASGVAGAAAENRQLYFVLEIR